MANTAKSGKAAKTASAEKKTRKTCKTNVNIEFNGLSVDVAKVQSSVKKAVKEKGLAPAELKIDSVSLL